MASCNSCTWAYDFRLHIASINEPKSSQQVKIIINDTIYFYYIFIFIYYFNFIVTVNIAMISVIINIICINVFYFHCFCNYCNCNCFHLPSSSITLYRRIVRCYPSLSYAETLIITFYKHHLIVLARRLAM